MEMVWWMFEIWPLYLDSFPLEHIALKGKHVKF